MAGPLLPHRHLRRGLRPPETPLAEGRIVPVHLRALPDLYPIRHPLRRQPGQVCGHPVLAQLGRDLPGLPGRHPLPLLVKKPQTEGRTPGHRGQRLHLLENSALRVVRPPLPHSRSQGVHGGLDQILPLPHLLLAAVPPLDHLERIIPHRKRPPKGKEGLIHTQSY